MNTVILLGRLTKEPEPNVTQSGIQILRFTLAVDRPKKKDQDTEADFIGCVAFGKTAEVSMAVQGQAANERIYVLCARKENPV